MPNKHKILIFSSVYSQGFGVFSVIKEQLKFLEKSFEVAIVTSDKEAISNSTAIIEIINPTIDNTQNVINKHKPEIIIVHTPPFYQLIAQSKTNAIKIAYDHGEPFPDLFPIQQKEAREKIDKTKKLAFNDFHYHISISEFIKRSSGIYSSKIIYNGFNPSKIRFFTNKFAQEPNEFTISSLSRIGEGENYYKRLDYLIKLKKNLSQLFKNRKININLIGRSVPPNNVIEQKLRNEGINLFINVSDEEKYKLLDNSDIFVSTSLWEGFNLPIIEAMSIGKPALALSSGAHPEVCPYHFQTIQELIQFISKLISNQELLTEVQNNCQNFVQDRFTWEKNANELISFIKNLLKNKNKLTLIRNTPTLNSNSIFSKNKHEICNGLKPFTYRIKYQIQGGDLVSIIIPFKDKIGYLKKCLDSIINKTTYSNFEILCINNDSQEQSTISAIKEYSKHEKIKFYNYDKPFNYSAINNYAAALAKGKHLLLLNNDIEIINNDWIESLLEHSQRENVGVVGGKLYYPNNTIQHAGVVIGISSAAGHIFRNMNKDKDSYMHKADTIQNVSAVTGACLMVKKTLYEKVRGLDQENLPVAFNDIDFCMRIQKIGYRNIFTPYCEAYHHECISRGSDRELKNIERFKKEIQYFKNKHKNEIENGDQHYNKNLSLDCENVYKD
jgi:glycosyltransferase involved in cell wall biosynthesis/GT2 family glycosyltransferase